MKHRHWAPILVLWDSDTEHRLSGYITEILYVEGYNWFAVHDLAHEPLTPALLAEYPTVTFTPTLQNAIHCSLDRAKAAVDGPKAILWDTRSRTEFEGTQAGYGPPVRMGRIPGAVHLECTELFDPDSKTLKPADELHTLLASAGITPESEIITYSHGGARASLATIVLKILGYDDARTYAGSYAQWASQKGTTVETG